MNKEKQFVEAPYYFYLIIDRFISGKSHALLKNDLFALPPELATGNFFISEVKEYWDIRS